MTESTGPWDDCEPEPAAILPGQLRPARSNDPPDNRLAWQAALARNDSGKPRKEVGNVALTLTHHHEWKSAIRYDAFADRVICADFPPLPELSKERPSLPAPPPGDLTDQHDVYASLWLARYWDMVFPQGLVHTGLVFAARHHAFHPLQDYLHACHAAWDGSPRLNTWAVDHLGVSDTPYARRVGAMYLLSAVARALEPGRKVDHVLVLEGPQGMGKTTALEILFGKDWFLPDLPDLRDKDAMHLLAGCWCALADELSAIRGAASVERAKSFFTRTIDVYRPPYAATSVRRPRTAIFAATTNAPEYLTDETGNRRYWSLLCSGSLDFDRLRVARDQLWGEAMHRLLRGERWWPDADLAQFVKEEQDQRVITDEWELMLRTFLDGREHITVGDCLRHLIPEETRFRNDDQRRVARALTRIGWTMHRPWTVTAGGVRYRERRYYAPGQWSGLDRST